MLTENCCKNQSMSSAITLCLRLMALIMRSSRRSRVMARMIR